MIRDAVAAHYRQMWGEASRRATYELSAHEIEVWKWDEDRNPEQVTMYATIGSSVHLMRGQPRSHRSEYFAGLRPSNDDIAKPLAMLALETISSPMEFGHGHTVIFPEPLWRTTAMNGFLIIRSQQEIVAPLDTSAGIHVEFLQAVPIFECEVESKIRHGVNGLLERWAAAGVAFWDPNRIEPATALP